MQYNVPSLGQCYYSNYIFTNKDTLHPGMCTIALLIIYINNTLLRKLLGEWQHGDSVFNTAKQFEVLLPLLLNLLPLGSVILRYITSLRWKVYWEDINEKLWILTYVSLPVRYVITASHDKTGKELALQVLGLFLTHALMRGEFVWYSCKFRG